MFPEGPGSSPDASQRPFLEGVRGRKEVAVRSVETPPGVDAAACRVLRACPPARNPPPLPASRIRDRADSAICWPRAMDARPPRDLPF